MGQRLKFLELTRLLDDLTYDNYAILVEELCYINANIHDELIGSPPIYAYWNGILATIKRERDLQELKLNTYISESRKAVKDAGLQKLTVRDLDDIVMSTPEYKELSELLIKNREKYDMIKSLVEALQHKKDMLIQLSANQRAEVNISK